MFILLANTTNLTFPNDISEKTTKDWVNPAEASEKEDCSSLSEPDDNIYCKEFDWSAFSPDRESVDEVCDASEDYAKNPKNCDKAYDLVEEKEQEQTKKAEKICDKVDGKWTKDGCDTDGSGDTPKADRFHEEQVKAEQEPTVIEDGQNQVYTKDFDVITAPPAYLTTDFDKFLKDIG